MYFDSGVDTSSLSPRAEQVKGPLPKFMSASKNRPHRAALAE